MPARRRDPWKRLASRPVRSALGVLVSIGAPGGPLHAGTPAAPVPHWLVLLAVVPALWLVVGTAVVAVDRLWRRFET